MVLKVVIVGAFVIAALYLVFRACDWYFNQREREAKIDAKKRLRRMERDDAVWRDGDPNTIDPAYFEGDRADEQIEVDVDDR